MGLAQLYQIRGRVGRSGRKAYAYFTFRRDKTLTDIAQKRLSAIREFTAFGSGFRIAMRDLQIRGAGSLLGHSQHGHMEAVGYDLYVKMLGQAIARAKGEPVQRPVITCKVELPLKEALDALAGNMLSTKKKITSWDRFNMISRLYGFIKRKNADVILAIIPQYNKLYYLDSGGKINRNRKITDSVYDTPLIFIKDTPEGRNFLKEQIIP